MLYVLEMIELSDFIPEVKIMSFFGREIVFKPWGKFEISSCDDSVSSNQENELVYLLNDYTVKVILHQTRFYDSFPTWLFFLQGSLQQQYYRKEDREKRDKKIYRKKEINTKFV